MVNSRTKTQQAYRTPPEFLAAVLRRFQVPRFDFDLACSSHDRVAPRGFEFPRYDAFEYDWTRSLDPDWLCWINPTFNISSRWAAKCASAERRILGLFPASASTVWHRQYVDKRALVIFVQPRIFFLNPDGSPIVDSKGRPTPIDRDCMLISWGMGLTGYECEDWRSW